MKSEKYKLIQFIYQKKKLYRFLAGEGLPLLGMHIHNVSPKTLEDWKDYIATTDILERFPHTLRANAKTKLFSKYRELIELISLED